jgi:C-terminal processing protease CtpA/Prc
MMKRVGIFFICYLLLYSGRIYAHQRKTPQGTIGIKVEQLQSGQLVVTGVVKAGPADLKGVRPGDVITHIDGVRSEQIPEISEHYLKGDIGSSVLLSVRREGVSEILEIKINRWQRIDRNPKPVNDEHSHSEQTKEKTDNNK